MLNKRKQKTILKLLIVQIAIVAGILPVHGQIGPRFPSEKKVITAADHPHPTFSPDGTKIEIQSAMLSEDDRSMYICIIPVPK